MKRFRSKLAVIMMMMLIFTSFEFVGVFAGDEDNVPAETTTVDEALGGDEDTDLEDADAPAVTEEVTEPEAEDVVDEALPEEEEEEDAPAITKQEESSSEDPEDPEDETEKIKKALTFSVDESDLQLLSGYECVVLRWKKKAVNGVKYFVYKGSTLVASTDMGNIKPYSYIGDRLTGDYLMCKFSQPVSTEDSLKTYKYTIKAVAGDVEGPVATSNKRAPVRTIAYKFKVKSSTKLKRHGGNGPKTYNLKAGQTLVAYGFGGGGCYMFKRKNSKGKESIFYCAKIRARSPKAIISKKFNYTPEEAELYVSQRQAAEKKLSNKSSKKGVKSKTKVFIWVNTYTQHLYYMEKKSGKWVCTDDWECSSGRAASPSPTGMYGVKKIEGKWKRHHNIPYWSKYSGTNSIHGKKGNLTNVNVPMSNGCIRNPNKKAKKVYKGAKVGTGVIIF